MAIKKNTTSKVEKEIEKVKHYITVLRAREIVSDKEYDLYGCDLEINGVKVYGCIFKQGTKNGNDWSLVDFPSYKARNGEYYSHAWCPLDKGDLANIEGQISTLINAK